MNDNFEHTLQCRICLDENENVEDLIKPCNCDGTQRYVHKKCLNTWIEYNIDNINSQRCQECHKFYEYEEIIFRYTLFNKIINISYTCVKKYYFILIIFTYCINFIFGLIGLFFSMYINSDLSDIIISFSSEYGYFTIPMVGNIIVSIFIFLYFVIHTFYIKLINFKFTDWKDSNNNTTNKILFLSSMVVLISILFAPFGFILGIMTSRLFYLHFIEFWFKKYVNKKRQILDLDSNYTNLEVNSLV